MTNKISNFIKLNGEIELQNYIFSIEEEIRNKISSFFVVPKEVEAIDNTETFGQLLEVAIDFVNELAEKGFDEGEYNKLKRLLEEDESNLGNLEEVLENIEKNSSIIKDIKDIYKMKERITRLFILKNLSFIKRLNKKHLTMLREVLSAIDSIKIKNKKGEIDINSVAKTKKLLEELKNSLTKTKEIIKSFMEISGLSKVTPSPELLQFLINSTIEERIVLYKEDYEDEYYEIRIIPFVEVVEIKPIETDTEFIISKIKFKYGIISNKYILIKEGKIVRNKNLEIPQKIIFNKKITNLINYNGNFLIVELSRNEEGLFEDLVYPLKPQIIEGIEQHLKKVAVTETTLNSKVGFYFRKNRLKANYVRGYGLVRHENIKFDLGSPISLLYSDSKSERLFYDYYDFKNSEKTFDEPPIIYKKLLSILEELKAKKHPYLYPLITTIGFTFSSIFIEVFKKQEALFPGLYFYGLKGTGKSLLLKLSKSLLGIKDNRVCDSFAQFRDLLASSNNIAYLDEIPENFDRRSEGKELLKNLLTSTEVTHQLSGRDSDVFTMRGTFFVTTNEPIEKVFGKDDALEERLIFVNFNYDNKISEDIAKELKYIVEELPQKSLSPTERGYTLLTNVIYLYYQLIKREYHEEGNIKTLIRKFSNYVDNIIRLKKLNDVARFRALITPILFGVYVFSDIIDREDIFKSFLKEFDKYIEWILKEHPSYSYNLKEQLYTEFVKYVGSITRLLAIDLFDLKYITNEQQITIDKEESKKKLSIILRNEGEESNKVFFIKKDNEYFVLTREEFIREFYKEYKDFYNYKKIEELKTDLSKVGIKDTGVMQVRKKILVIDGVTNRVYLESSKNNRKIKVKLIKIPRFIVDEIDNKLIRDLDKAKNLNGDVNIEKKELQQVKITDFFKDYLKGIETLKEELEEGSNNVKVGEDII